MKSKAQILVDTSLLIINNHLEKGNYQFAMKKTKLLLTKISNSQKQLQNSVIVQGKKSLTLLNYMIFSLQSRRNLVYLPMHYLLLKRLYYWANPATKKN
jgi:hypothetical protein